MLAQKLILSYSSKIVIQFIQIVASIVVARIAGPTVLGTVAFGLAFVSIFAFIADLGIGSAHMKLVSEGQDVGSCISTYSFLKMANCGWFQAKYWRRSSAMTGQATCGNCKMRSNVTLWWEVSSSFRPPSMMVRNQESPKKQEETRRPKKTPVSLGALQRLREFS